VYGFGPVKILPSDNPPSNIIPQKAPEGQMWRPVVLWHGMGDTCCYPFSMGYIKGIIEKYYAGIFVYSLEIGNTIEEDEWNGFFMNVNDQVSYVCNKLINITILQQGFNAMGFSQGSQFLRAYVERCNKPSVYNLISIGGQHQGVYGFPNCPGNKYYFCDMVRYLLSLGTYESFVQDRVVQAEYWQDPLDEAEYLAKCVFLPDINNAKNGSINQQYKQNLISLNSFTMVKFLNDTMVQPKESEWFGFYKAGQDQVTIPYNETNLYIQDLIGLKTLDQQKKLSFLSCIGEHLQFTEEWFVQNIIPLLNNTIAL